MGAEAKAKTMTSPLIIPSVLWARPYLFVSLSENCQGLQILIFFSPGAETILCRRGEEKF